jgi:hypothetical protein
MKDVIGIYWMPSGLPVNRTSKFPLTCLWWALATKLTPQVWYLYAKPLPYRDAAATYRKEIDLQGGDAIKNNCDL